jgi:hypothetical protein
VEAPADPIADAAQQAAAAAGLPIWVQILLAVLVPALAAALRAWIRERQFSAAVMAGAERAQREAPHAARTIQESLRSEQIKRGTQKLAKDRLDALRKAERERLKDEEPPGPGPAAR